MYKREAIFITLFLLIVVIAISTSLFSYEIDNYTSTFIDENRNDREIEVEIFFPIVDSVGESFPILIFGHGWLMNYSQYTELTEALVSFGTIMVFPRTEEGVFPDHENFALDLLFLVDEIQGQNNEPTSNLYNIVLPISIAMGHSMGGGCSLLAANENEQFDSVINFAAAETDPSAIQAANNVDCPSLIFSGENDVISPPINNQLPMYENLLSDLKYHINIFGESHLGLPSNDLIPSIITPFINFIVTEDEDYYNSFHAIIDSLQTNNYLDFMYENTASIHDYSVLDLYYNFTNYPNPFNPSTTIEFSIPKDSIIKLSIFNIKGQRIKTLTNNQLSKGYHSIVWNGDDESNKSVSSGVYLYKLNVNGKTEASKKCLLLK